jgi:hypothetical protein
MNVKRANGGADVRCRRENDRPVRQGQPDKKKSGGHNGRRF